MHSARLGIRFFTEVDQLPAVLATLREHFGPPKAGEFTARGTFNADKDGGASADAALKIDVQAISAGAPAEVGAALKAAYDNQGLVDLTLKAIYGGP